MRIPEDVMPSHRELVRSMRHELGVMRGRVMICGAIRKQVRED